jgi:hypothetical protein
MAMGGGFGGRHEMVACGVMVEVVCTVGGGGAAMGGDLGAGCGLGCGDGGVVSGVMVAAMVCCTRGPWSSRRRYVLDGNVGEYMFAVAAVT